MPNNRLQATRKSGAGIGVLSMVRQAALAGA